MVTTNGVRALRADWTTKDEAISKLMLKLQDSQQLPLLAIFPANDPNRPLVLKTFYSTAKLLEKLEQAGPSQGAVIAAKGAKGGTDSQHQNARSPRDEMASMLP